MAEKVTDVVSGKIETTVTEQTTSEKETVNYDGRPFGLVL